MAIPHRMAADRPLSAGREDGLYVRVQRSMLESDSLRDRQHRSTPGQRGSVTVGRYHIRLSSDGMCVRCMSEKYRETLIGNLLGNTLCHSHPLI